MIVSIFRKPKQGQGKAASAINYLLGHDANGNKRNPPAEIFEGDKDLTAMLIDSQGPKKKNRYTSGAIAFRDNEKPTKAQLKEIVQSFRDIFAPGMGEDKVNMLWVLHQEKGNTELHFIIPQIATFGNKTRRFNICPPGKHGQQLQRDFSAYWNDKLYEHGKPGYEQVREDPIKAEFSQFDAKVPDGSKNKARKERLSYEISKRIHAGTINNRRDLIDFLNKKDFKVTRKGKDYLSIVMPEKTKAIRFKGGCFVESSNYQELVKQSKNNRKGLTQVERNEVVTRINDQIKYRMEFNQKNYAIKNRMQKLESVNIGKPQQIKSNSNTSADVQQKKSIQPKPSNVQKSQNMQNSNASGSSPSTVSSGNSLERLMANIGSLENKITALGIKLSQVPTEQRAQIEKQIAELKMQLMRLQQQLEEARKANLNRLKI